MEYFHMSNLILLPTWNKINSLLISNFLQIFLFLKIWLETLNTCYMEKETPIYSCHLGQFIHAFLIIGIRNTKMLRDTQMYPCFPQILKYVLHSCSLSL